MAKSFSVQAILSAKDSGFTSTLKKCSSALDHIDSKISGFSFGLLTGAGQAAFNALANGASNLVGEINDSSAAWKTFSSNMKIIHGDTKKTEKMIGDVKGELQDFAQKTVYSSSDMASTYAQLAAVGTKNTAKLVKGFGGLAAAAENPQQAMKTLSQQATQMAAKPNVAWADFKLMLEQTPAGIAAVAKEMGMSTSEMVTAVQDGKVKTDAFFDAIQKVGTSDDFYNLATEAKTVGQAMDGLQETLGNKLMPTFDKLTKYGIKAVDKIATKIEGFDASKLTKFFDGCIEYGKALIPTFISVKDSLGEAFSAIKTSFEDLTGKFGSDKSIEGFKGLVESVANVIKKIADLATQHADEIAWLIAHLPQIVLAIKGFKIAKTVAPFVGTFASGITSLASKGIGGIASKLFGISGAQKTVGETSATSGTQMLTAAKSYALMGVAVLAIAAGFALLAFSAIALANAGGLAIGVMAGLVVGVAAIGIGMAVLLKALAPMSGQLMPVATAFLTMGAAVLLVSAGFAILAATSIALANAGGAAIGIMVGMVATVALLAIGAAALAPALTAGAVGLIAFGVAVVLVATGALLAAAALAVVTSTLPTLVVYGTQGATAILALGGAMIVFAAGAALAGVGLLALSVGMIAFGASVIVASAGMLVFAAGMIAGAAGVAVMAGALKLVNSQMKNISKNAKSTQKSLTSMKGSIKVVESGLDALGSKAKSAMDKLKSAFDTTATNAQTAGQKTGTGFATGMQPGLIMAATFVTTMATKIVSVFTAMTTKVVSAGKNIGAGFASGLQSGMSKSTSVASKEVKAVVTTLRSGRSGAYSAGAYVSQGFAQGMQSCLGAIRSAAAQMAAAADAAVRAKAKIHSPSKVSEKLGAYWGSGYVGGLESMVKDAWKVAQELVSIPTVATPNLATAYGWDLSSDYDYYRNNQYVIEVPVVLDGRETARVIAPYTQEEINRQQTRDSRKHGRA